MSLLLVVAAAARCYDAARRAAMLIRRSAMPLRRYATTRFRDYLAVTLMFHAHFE